MDTPSRKRKLAIKLAIVGLAVFAAVWMSSITPFIRPVGMPPEMNPAAPQRCVGLFLVCMSLWFTNLIPPAATGALPIQAWLSPGAVDAALRRGWQNGLPSRAGRYIFGTAVQSPGMVWLERITWPKAKENK